MNGKKEPKLGPLVPWFLPYFLSGTLEPGVLLGLLLKLYSSLTE
jgi:hypothetical protein